MNWFWLLNKTAVTSKQDCSVTASILLQSTKQKIFITDTVVVLSINTEHTVNNHQNAVSTRVSINKIQKQSPPPPPICANDVANQTKRFAAAIIQLASEGL